MGIVQSLAGGTNAPGPAPETSDNNAASSQSATGSSALNADSPPPMPGTFIITHPQPPPRTPTTTTPARTPLTSMLSYFLPISTPDLSHTHGRPTPSDLRLTALYLTHLGLPGELVPRILDAAEDWSVCTREMKKQVRVVAGAQPPRRAVHIGARWLNGQEDEDGIREIIALGGEGGLRESEGDCWILCSGEIGCVEEWDPVLDRLQREEEEGQEGVDLQPRDAGVSRPGQTQGLTDGPGVGLEDGADVRGPNAGATKRERKGWLRQVKVTTDSKDQGWSTSNTEAYGTYDHSYTWFELSLIRDGKQVEGSRLDIQHNVHAGQYFKKHEIVLGPEAEFVRMAKPGDRVVLWARALYAGWHNNVREASLSIYTAPFPPGA